MKSIKEIHNTNIYIHTPTAEEFEALMILASEAGYRILHRGNWASYGEDCCFNVESGGCLYGNKSYYEGELGWEKHNASDYLTEKEPQYEIF